VPLRTPSYRLQKPTGQAVVTLGGKDHYLGKHGTPRSRAEYDRLIALWLVHGRRLPPARAGAPGGISVNELILAYFHHVQGYYRHPDGRPTSEVDNIRLALRWPRRLHGHTPAADFDSLALEALRGEMVRAGLCRNRVNKDVARIKRMFKWGAGRKAVPAAVCESLAAAEGLRAGRSDAAETEPVRPVAGPVVEAVLPHVSPQVAAMLALQYHTGARPGEVIAMRTADLDVSGPVWAYRPAAHKTRWRGQDRVILVGPRGQAVPQPWLRPNGEEHLFQPREARALWDAGRRQRRRTPVPPSQARRRPTARPERAPAPATRRPATPTPSPGGSRRPTRRGRAGRAGGSGPGTAAGSARRRCRTSTRTSCGTPRRRRSGGRRASTRGGRCWGTAARRSPRPTPRSTWPRPRR
jgi:integrase